MAYEFRLQDPGEGIHEAEILEIPVARGDRVSEGDTVIVAETDKAAVEIPAPMDGEIQEIRVAVGDVAKVGDVLMVFGDGAEADEDDEAREKDADGAGEDERRDGADDPPDGEADDRQGAKSGADGSSGDEDGSGEQVGREDEAAPQDDDAAQDEDGGGATKTADPDPDSSAKPRATPAVRGLAREKGLDLSAIEGSGDDGRILEKDVMAAADPADDGIGAESGDGAKDGDGVKIVELRSLRRTMARRMAQAWRDIPHVTHQDVIEITALERLRREHEAEIAELGGALTLTPFIVKALAIALAEFPDFNATFDADACAVRRLPRYDIGVALDTDRGLLVPVLRDAGRRSIAELAVNLSELGERLRDDSATREDLRGATFTLTNVGAIGGTGLAPIINPPQTAIFGVARAELRQLVRGDIDDHTLEVALCLPVCLTFDHRVADGAEAARFVERVKALLDDPGALVLNS